MPKFNKGDIVRVVTPEYNDDRLGVTKSMHARAGEAYSVLSTDHRGNLDLSDLEGMLQSRFVAMVHEDNVVLRDAPTGEFKVGDRIRATSDQWHSWDRTKTMKSAHIRAGKEYEVTRLDPHNLVVKGVDGVVGLLGKEFAEPAHGFKVGDKIRATGNHFNWKSSRTGESTVIESIHVKTGEEYEVIHVHDGGNLAVKGPINAVASQRGVSGLLGVQFATRLEVAPAPTPVSDEIQVGDTVRVITPKFWCGQVLTASEYALAGETYTVHHVRLGDGRNIEVTGGKTNHATGLYGIVAKENVVLVRRAAGFRIGDKVVVTADQPTYTSAVTATEKPCQYAQKGGVYTVTAVGSGSVEGRLAIRGDETRTASGRTLSGYIDDKHVELYHEPAGWSDAGYITDTPEVFRRPARLSDLAGKTLEFEVKNVSPAVLRTIYGHDLATAQPKYDIRIDASVTDLASEVHENVRRMVGRLSPPALPAPKRPHRWTEVVAGDIVTVETTLPNLIGRPDTVDNTAVITAPVVTDRDGNLRWRELDLSIHRNYDDAYKILQIEKPAPPPAPKTREERRKPRSFQLVRKVPANGIFEATTVRSTGLGVVEDGYLISYVGPSTKENRVKIKPGRDSLKLYDADLPKQPNDGETYHEYTYLLETAEKLTHDPS